MFQIGENVKYNEEVYVILDKTPDGNLIIGRDNNCETEVSKDDVSFVSLPKIR